MFETVALFGLLFVWLSLPMVALGAVILDCSKHNKKGGDDDAA